MRWLSDFQTMRAALPRETRDLPGSPPREEARLVAGIRQKRLVAARVKWPL